MNVTVVGTGYVGLVTGCCLASSGNRVVCVDNNSGKVAELIKGKVPIFEPQLEDLMKKSVSDGNLTFTTNLAEGIAEADVIFLALPTPPNEDGSADLSAVLAVAESLGKILPNKFCVIVNKSTVPVGTADKVRAEIAINAKTEFDVVSNPEFLREGFAVQDFLHPERVVVGVSSKKSEEVMRKLYEPFVSDERPLYITDPQTAELAKYAANSFLVTKISFMNEMSHLTEKFDADIDMLKLAIGSDSRIGMKFLNAGIGSGGSCFPKDIRALRHMADEQGYDFKMLKSATIINDQQQRLLVEKLADHFNGDIKGKTFALWGLAFKPNTDDIREAPALVIIDQLLEAGAKVKAYDPEAADNVKKLYPDNPDLEVVDEKYSALENSEALLVATEWQEFKDSDLVRIQKSLISPLVFDGRNIWKPAKMREAGFTYYSIGRRPVIG